MDLINFELLRHPLNWLTVILMVFIGGIAVHLILQYQTDGSPLRKSNP